VKTIDYLGIVSFIRIATFLGNMGLEVVQMFRYLSTFPYNPGIMDRKITKCKNVRKWLITSLCTFLDWMHFLTRFLNKGFVIHEYYCLWL